MPIFKCDICSEKDIRINDHKAEINRLVAQVEMFRKLAFPEKNMSLSPQEIEFNRLMGDASEDQLERESLEAHQLLTSGGIE